MITGDHQAQTNPFLLGSKFDDMGAFFNASENLLAKNKQA